MDSELRFQGIRRARWGWGGAGLAGGLWLLLQLGGCSVAESGGPSCASQCGDLCKALGACDVEVPSNCKSQCTTGVGSTNCSQAHAPDQLTCAELKASYACADYCTTLCTRAPSCGSFDSKQCAQGCALQSHSICNAASVEARTCDQLKPELRDYQDIARAEQGGSHLETGGSLEAYGLCTEADDCELPLGCTAATNACSACASDGDCKRPFFSYICSAEKECTKVDCAADEDCPGRVCDTQRHACVECREDADCTGLYKRCNPQTATCAQCRTDADCSGSVPRCDVTTYGCAQCLTNADCAKQQFLPRCEVEREFKLCGTCQVDADCAGRDHPLCGDSQCVDCRVDADCKDPAAPVCDTLLGRCTR